MIQRIFLLILLFIPDQAFGYVNTCQDEENLSANLTSEEFEACNNYYANSGHWNLSYTKKSDTCNGQFESPSILKEKVKIKHPFAFDWYYKNYRNTTRFYADPSTYLYAVWELLNGTKFMWPEWYQAHGYPKQIFSERRRIKTACKLGYGCTKNYISELTYDSENDSLKGKHKIKYFFMGKYRCEATYTIKGKRVE